MQISSALVMCLYGVLLTMPQQVSMLAHLLCTEESREVQAYAVLPAVYHGHMWYAENGCLQVLCAHCDGCRIDPVSLPVKAGCAIVMADDVLHCSPANMSQSRRRAWMPQFSITPITCGLGPVSLAVPFTCCNQLLKGQHPWKVA